MGITVDRQNSFSGDSKIVKVSAKCELWMILRIDKTVPLRRE